jgi:hypothetical protein
MLKIFKKKVNKNLDFFELPAREQKKMIEKVVKGANKDQADLVRRYEQRHKRLELNECVR